MISKAWPFEEARRLLKRYEKAPPKKGYVLFETGYGPSGLPHIGTFGEVQRTTMIRRAFELISDIPTRLICFSDDVDGMRKVPENVPQQDMLRQHMQKPLTSVPDPYGEYESFGHHNNAMLRRFLDTFGFEYEFISATDFYKSGQFDDTLKLAVERYEAIMEIMLASLREERQQTYSCFLPIHPETGRVLYVPMKHIDKVNHTITFDDESWPGMDAAGDGRAGEAAMEAGFRGALGGAWMWTSRCTARITAPTRRSMTGSAKCWGARKPEHFTYELFLDEQGQKISKSKGNGLTIDEWLTYAATESLGYFMYQKPKTAKRMHFDVIPKAVDEYHQQLRAYPSQDDAGKLANPVWHLHHGQPPASDMVVPFAMLLNLASVASAKDKTGLWGFIKRNMRRGHRLKPTRSWMQAAEFAVRYYRDFVAPTRTFRLPTDMERAAMEDLLGRLKGWTGGLDDEALQTMVFAVGTEHKFEPLRNWFTALYEVLLGASQGPRFGGFIALYGVEESVALIERALAGKLLA